MLHLLYARFWHKVLFDLGHVSSSEPYARLFNQGYILAGAYIDERGVYVDAAKCHRRADGRLLLRRPARQREWGKMGKTSRTRCRPTRCTTPTAADTLRLHLMAMGPLDAPARGRRATSSACTASCSGCGATSSTR